MWRLAGLTGIAVSALVAVVGLVFLYGADRFERPGPLDADTVVYVAPGSGLKAIAADLHANGVIDDALVFRLGVRVLGKSRALKSGEYVFPESVSMRGAADILMSGRTLVRRLTVAEGLTSFEIRALIEQAEALDGTVKNLPAEGSLLPETYHYVRGGTRAELVERMGRALDQVMADLWPKRAPGLPLATPEAAVVLASIVEKETAVAAERPMIASVFINRLNKGMRLQSDPTVVYGLTLGSGPLGRALTRKDLQTPSAYNTYLIDALPPGPIANPGRAAIQAVLNPATTEYLYFVADGSGGHAFAKTLAEHNRNVAKWRKIQRQQN